MIDKKDIPSYVRRCYDRARTSMQLNRAAYNERLKAYASDMWLATEKTARIADNRPMLVENRLKPAVDQIEGDIRLNPPGPQCLPVGELHDDAADPDIIAGMIRECEYRSHADTAYSTAGKYAAAGGEAYIELCTEYVGDRSLEQQLRIDSVEDPSVVFFDPDARRANREDAMWAGKLRKYSKEEYEARFGKDRRALQPQLMQAARGWIADAIGLDSNMAGVNEWTGVGRGPFFVCEFHMIEEKRIKLRMYSDGVTRYDNEDVPKGVTRRDGDEYEREVPQRTIHKYLVDAFETLEETEWLGRLIPLFPVLGPEIYIDGVLHRLSLISGAIDSNRALNYTITTAVEFVGNMSKAPWMGPEGTFDSPKWKDANRKIYDFLEWRPVYATNENGEQTLLPPPQKNVYEAAIQWVIALATYFRDAVKGVTSVYDPTLGHAPADQSGTAIQKLQSQSSVNNFSYADNLHRAIEIMYGEICYLLPILYDKEQAIQIVRPDTKPESVQINQIFSDARPKQKGEKANNLSLGEYSVRVTAGPNFKTRQQQAIQSITDVVKAIPQITQNPAAAAQLIRMIGEGNPQVEAIADLISPAPDSEITPAQMQAKIVTLGQQNQALTVGLQQLKMQIASKQPDIDARKWEKAIDSLTKLAVAEVTASADADQNEADRIQDALGKLLDMGQQQNSQSSQQQSDQSMQQGQQQHEAGMQQSQQQAAQQSQATDQAHQAAMAQQAQQSQETVQ